MTLKYGFATTKYGTSIIEASQVLKLQEKLQQTERDNPRERDSCLEKITPLADAHCHARVPIRGTTPEQEEVRTLLHSYY
ncbi:MAG: hypothetical protein ACOCUU_01420 [Nanoarchaeota archaeon]